MSTFTFRKPEHLCRKTEIEALFTPGSHSFTVYPLRATYRRADRTSGPAVKVLLSVSKRRLHHAVDRNRAKRQLREAYRLQKHLLLEAMPEDTALHIAFIWLAEKPVRTQTVMERMRAILLRTADRLQAVKTADSVENHAVSPKSNAASAESNAAPANPTAAAVEKSAAATES